MLAIATQTSVGIVMLIEMENAWVDPAHIVIVLALIVNYIGQWLQIRKQNKLNK